jgi:hypothetical protein
MVVSSTAIARKYMDEEQIRSALGDRNLMRVSEATGIHHNTLVRFRKGHNPPREGTLDKLREYLSR